MANMTVAEMDYRLRGLIGEPSQDRFPLQDSATLGIGTYTLLSDGIRVFCAETQWTKSTASFTVNGNNTVSDNTRIYSFKSDVLAIDKNDVTFNSLRILPITKHELHSLDIDYDADNAGDEKWLELSGTPEYYYMEKEDVFGLYPAPDASNDGLTMKYTYYESPDAVTTSTDSAAIIWDLTWAAIYFAASRFFENDGNPQAADRYEQKFWRAVEMAKRRRRRDQREDPLVVGVNRQYYVDRDTWIRFWDVEPGRRRR